MQLFLSAPAALRGWELRAGRGVGSHAPEGLADSVLWFLLFQEFLPAFDWSQASQACPTQGLKSPQATPHTGWLGTVSEGQSETSCHTVLSTREDSPIQAENIFKAECSVKATTYSFPGSNQQQGFIPQTLLKMNSDLPWGHF